MSRGGIHREAPSPAPGLRASGLGVRRGGAWVLEGVGLEARPGQIVTLVGPNGSGKSTLLELLSGLRPADRGEIELGGLRLDRFADFARRVALLPEASEPAEETRVSELLAHARSLRPRPEPLLRALEEALSLGPLRGASAGALSRGERQRVALFCALSLERELVLLDEPFGAFDPLQLREVLEAVREVARAGSTVVASVHQMIDAERLGGPVLVLSSGRPLAFGPLAELKAQAGCPSGTLEDAVVALLTRGRP